MKSRTIMMGMAVLLSTTLIGCTGPVRGNLVVRTVPGGDRSLGRQLIAEYGCGSCHQINGIPGATALVGPPLQDFHARSFVAGSLPNNWENLAQWVQDPQSINPQSAMPNLGINEQEARHIAAYLYSQPSDFWLGNRGR